MEQPNPKAKRSTSTPHRSRSKSPYAQPLTTRNQTPSQKTRPTSKQCSARSPVTPRSTSTPKITPVLRSEQVSKDRPKESFPALSKPRTPPRVRSSVNLPSNSPPNPSNQQPRPRGYAQSTLFIHTIGGTVSLRVLERRVALYGKVLWFGEDNEVDKCIVAVLELVEQAENAVKGLNGTKLAGTKLAVRRGVNENVHKQNASENQPKPVDVPSEEKEELSLFDMLSAESHREDLGSSFAPWQTAAYYGK
ncbi:hypothetical protein BLNAU_20282 [Blattamonas nauphoetae]|uniref:RRM domain-containing protein n=1 Tax=Blattamonas nauphoetae TaxID=2049346 RepID=A0ABQ9WZ65_9EUKA|nr:hypothetical protein BLNAU_20282 [Blattamonas nauphoetae]